MPNTRIEYTIFNLTTLNCLVRTGFRFNGFDYVGIREGDGYKADERAWGESEKGGWLGSPAPLTIPANLTIDGATEIERDPDTSRDTVLRVASASTLVARWGLLYRTQIGGSATFSVKVWNAATGAQVLLATTSGAFPYDASTLTSELGELPDGDYILGCAITGATPKHLTEAEYSALTGRAVRAVYRYEQDGQEYFYDYDRNLGVRPSDPNAQQNVEREAVEAAGTQIDESQWIQYATSHDSLASEWALTKFVVGAGDWEAGSAELLGLGAALFKATIGVNPTVTGANRSTYVLAFDPMARSVASWLLASDGTLYLGGDRSTLSGPETALWSFDGTTATLLATGPKLSTGLCECGGLQDHAARKIVETYDGKIIAQTLCSNYRYDPNASSIENRLKPTPLNTDGHPGGRSLVTLGRERIWTTEHFGGKGIIEGSIAAQFYDTVQKASGENAATNGVGVVAHLDGNLAVYHGAVRGIIQDKPFDDATAKQSVARLTGAGWQLVAGITGYSIGDVRLYRVAQIGRYFLADGKEAESENPACYVSNGVLVVRADCVHRLRAISTVLNSSGYETGLAPASLPGEAYPRRLVEIGDPATGLIFEEETPEGDFTPATNAQEELDIFGDGSFWFGEPLIVWGENESLTGVALVDAAAPDAPSAARDFTAYFESWKASAAALVWARIDSDADVDDLESYILAVPHLGKQWFLPRPARVKVEFVVVLPSDAEKMEPLRLLPIS